MAFVVVYDACVLYPMTVRDLLLRIANTGVVRARWSERILDECFRNVRKNLPHIPEAALDRTRRQMIEGVPDCLVRGTRTSSPDSICLIRTIATCSQRRSGRGRRRS
jgi:hypothetical protein